MGQIQIRLFGAFRNLIPQESIILNIEDNASVQDVKTNLKQYINNLGKNIDDKLIYESALSTETEILTLDATVKAGSTLAILPPVCGG